MRKHRRAYAVYQLPRHFGRVNAAAAVDWSGVDALLQIDHRARSACASQVCRSKPGPVESVVIIHATDGRRPAGEDSNCGGYRVGRLGCKCIGVVHAGRRQLGERRTGVSLHPLSQILRMHPVYADHQNRFDFGPIGPVRRGDERGDQAQPSQ